jgi:pilus assembly protein FimV
LAINKRKILQSAQKHVQKGAFDKALEDYRAVLKADPKDSNIRLKVGDLYLKLGKTDDAVASYLKVAERFMKEGFDAKAVALYKQVTKLDPKRHDVYEPLADVYQRMGLTQDAMKALQIAADAAYKDGDKIEALGLLRKMGALDPGNTTNRIKVADLLHQEGQNGEAIDEYLEIAEELERQGVPEERLPVLGRILEIEPERLDTLLEVGRGHLAAEQWDEAQALGRTATAAHPDELEGHELLGRALEGAGQDAECERVFHHVADVYRQRGDDERARDLAQRYGGDAQFSVDDNDGEMLDPGAAIDGDVSFDASANADDRFDDPGFSQEGLSLGAPIEELRDESSGHEDALETDAGFDEELTFDEMEPSPDDAPAPMEAERTIVDMAPAVDADEAPPAAAASGAGSADAGPAPEDPEALLAEASVYLRYGKHERAIESLRAVVSAVPDHTGALEKLGEALAANGDTSNAVTAYERAAAALEADADADGVVRVRDKLAEIDPDAARALVGDAPDADASSGGVEDFEIEIDDELEDEIPREEPAELPSEDASATPDLDADIEIDLDLGAEAGDLPSETVGADAGESAESGPSDFEIDLDLAAEEEDAEGTDPTEAPDDSPEVALDDVDTLEESDDARDDLDEEELIFGEGGPSEPADISADDAPGAVEEELVFEDADEEAHHADEPAGSDDEFSGLEFVDDGPRAEADATDPLAYGSDAEKSEPSDEVDEASESEDPEDPSSGSSTTPSQIVEDLEEAEFYFSQGMLAEARPVYERIMSLAPGHAKAMLRLGEIEAAGIGSADAPEMAEEPAEEPLSAGAEADAGVDADADFDGEAADESEGFDFGDDDAASDDLVDEDAVVSLSGEEEETEEPVDAPSSEPAPDDPDAGDFELPLADEDAADEDAGDEVGAAVDGDAFDLAAELSDALGDSSSALGDSTGAGGTSGQGLAGTTEGEGFEQVFAAFKQGVQGALDDDGDQQAHYDLGIAYREMGLLDDAIGEFQNAMTATEHRLASLHMMALCAIDLDRPGDAVAHLEQGLSEGEAPEEHQIGLRFDLGRAHAMLGDVERARACFEAVQAIDPEFCDVAQVIAELAAPTEPASGADEAFESFDDLIGGEPDDADDAGLEAVAEPAYESFDDLMGDDDDDAIEPAAAAIEAEPAESADPADPPQAEAVPEPAEEPAAAPSEEAGKPKRGRRKKISFV